MNKQLSDVLEYLYKQDKKELAEVVLTEVRQKEIIREVPQQPDRAIHDQTSLPSPYITGTGTQKYPPLHGARTI